MRKQEGKMILLNEYLSVKTSRRKLAAKYGLGTSTVNRWLMAARKEVGDDYQPPRAEPAEQVGQTVPEAIRQIGEIKQLQEALYHAQLKVSLLEAMIDISDEQFGTHIRKKPGTSPL